MNAFLVALLLLSYLVLFTLIIFVTIDICLHSKALYIAVTKEKIDEYKKDPNRLALGAGFRLYKRMKPFDK